MKAVKILVIGLVILICSGCQEATTTQMDRLTPIPLLPETKSTDFEVEIADFGTKSTEFEISDQKIAVETEIETEPQEPDIYQMDVWDLGAYLYGISYLDTSRSLKLITYEGYGYSPLSYYVACCCWTRATENYWGYGNLFSAFGEFAIDALWQCYMSPMYVKYCNGMAAPSDYIYQESGIYVWN